MEIDAQLKLSSTSKKQNIFHVRRLPYKQFDNQKYLKENYSPLRADKPAKDTHITLPLKHRESSNLSNTINMEYYFHLSLTSSPAYKQLQSKYKALKDRHKQEKEQKIKVNNELSQILRQKEQQLQKWISERKRIEYEQQKLMRKREELCYHIQRLREHRQRALQYRNQEQQLPNMEQMRNMIMAMHYQGGIDIDPDNMTYEELLQLEEKIGKVSKGLSQQQYQSIEIATANKGDQEQLCSICYYNVKEGEQIHKLPCKHVFHCECIKEWLLQEKVCPMCKQEIVLAKKKEEESREDQ